VPSVAAADGCPPQPGAATTPLTEPAPGSSATVPAADAILVCVGPAAITGAVYSHWLTVAEAGTKEAAPVLHREVLDFLITGLWMVAEADRLGIHVSATVVRRTFDRIRDQQFPRRREFRRFLHESRQTVADLLYRVELNMLSSRILARVTGGRHGARTPRALSRYTAGFRKRWRAQTYCVPQFAVADCGHVQAGL
jgi:hypothetical protein